MRRCVWVIMKGAAGVTAMSLLGGVGLTLAATQLLSNMLFQVDPRDPVPLLGICCCVIFVALTACFVPALKAARANPLVMLRET